jgi:raffinose/stachyose/melibiose transport system permease protein
MTDPTSAGARVSPAATGGPFDTALLLKYLFLLFVAGLVLVPLLATVLGGFKSLGDLRVNPFGLPATWVASNYWDLLTGEMLWRMLGNSLLIGLLTTVLSLATASMVAFLFAHLTFFGDRFLLNYFLLGLLFPAATAVLPLFIKIRDLGLLDTYWGVILPQTAFSLGLAILLFRRFFKELPTSLLDAAMIDGCGYARFFWHITLPLSRPILSTVAVFVFVQSWNKYLLPLVVLNSDAMYPWPLGVMVFQGEYATEWSLVLAFITLTILPAIAMFLLAQKHIVAGLTAGAVKG